MFKEVMEHIKTALILLIVFTLVTGLLYPLAVTGLAQLLFPAKANGSLIKQNDHVIGSQLIGQFFLPRPIFGVDPQPQALILIMEKPQPDPI